MNVKRGELYYADLSPVVGSEQGGIRPVLVVQNDVGNKYSPTIIAAAVTSKINKAKLPTHIELPSAYGLAKDSVILLEQIRTIDKRRLKERIGELPPSTSQQGNFNQSRLHAGELTAKAFSFSAHTMFFIIFPHTA